MLSKSVLFLQGPLGPFFRELAREFSAHDYRTHKINFNGGDRFYSGADHCVDYVGSVTDWPGFLERYLTGHGIQSVFLMGDCRLYHRMAKPVCDRLGVDFMVFEEGYLRPDTITLEKGGVNALTALDFSRAALAAASSQRQQADVAMPASMKQRIVYAALYYWAAFFQRNRFDQYQHHRAFHPIIEGAKWWRGLGRKYRCKGRDGQIQNRLTGELSGRFFLVALQVHDDSQMRYHSDYESVEAFIEEVVASFAAYARDDETLVFKHHPMDRGYTDYQQTIEALAEHHGVAKRVLYCHDISLPELYHHTKGVVTVNSTVGISALLHLLPVKVTGQAFYDIAGLTSQCSLNQFWLTPEPVHAGLFDRFYSIIFRESQINGSFFRELPLSCENARLFYEQRFRGRRIAEIVNVAEPVQTVMDGEQAVA
ncbi:capsule biosynthesis protein [Endozoicomonas sp.]|uniref:capsule biosynthesis protein n=1 Tax=Endozoicomonas sp. TaxID=1892382 RepID=UPI002885BE76|nr:capsular biosynthesis protein [Endozoicomonas sp.]